MLSAPPSPPTNLIQVLVLGFHRRLQIEDFEARIALMPLLQAEKDRRWGHQDQGQEVTGLSSSACSVGTQQKCTGGLAAAPLYTWTAVTLGEGPYTKWIPKGENRKASCKRGWRDVGAGARG